MTTCGSISPAGWASSCRAAWQRDQLRSERSLVEQVVNLRAQLQSARAALDAARADLATAPGAALPETAIAPARHLEALGATACFPPRPAPPPPPPRVVHQPVLVPVGSIFDVMA